MTIFDLVRLAIVRTAEEGEVPSGLQDEEPGYDAWFRERVPEALDDPRPPLSDEEVRDRQERVGAKMGLAGR